MKPAKQQHNPPSLPKLPLHRAIRYKYQVCGRCGEQLDPTSDYYCTRHKLANNKIQHSLTQQRIAEGKCPSCSKPRTPDDNQRYRCKSCREKELAAINEKRRAWIQAGLCGRCGKVKLARDAEGNGYKNCLACRVRIGKSQARRYRMNKKKYRE